MRFLVDMALSPGLADWLVAKGHDAVHAGAIGLAQAADTDILERARADDRIVVTADLDYPRLLALSNAARPALVLFRGGDWSEILVLERMHAALTSILPHELSSSIVVVEQTRIRRRPLPLQF